MIKMETNLRVPGTTQLELYMQQLKWLVILMRRFFYWGKKAQIAKKDSKELKK